MQESGEETQKAAADWDQVDARALGQILAAQNLITVLPDDKHIAQFFSQALAGVPGVVSSFVCLGEPPPELERSGEVCPECPALLGREEGIPTGPPEIRCTRLSGRDLRIIPLSTRDRAFGAFALRTGPGGVLDAYLAFLANLAGQVALSLENRMQRLLLEKARDELEERVRRRTQQLTAMNDILEENLRERRSFEEKLIQEKERAQTYLDTAGVMFLGLDTDGRITLINHKGCDIIGYTEAELLGRNWFDLCAPPSEQESRRSAFQGMLAGEDRFRVYESVVLTRTGEPRVIDWRISFLRDEEETIVGVFGSGEDITERKRAEEQIRQLNQELEQRVLDRTAQLEAANRELEAFAYSVSHDLRAPLRHVDAYLELLREEAAEGLNDEARHYVTAASEAARRMGVLIEDLLSFSRMGRGEIAEAPVDLNVLVTDVLGGLAAETEGRSIVWRIGSLPQVTGDRAMLRQVLVNLLSNALKFTRGVPQPIIQIGAQASGKKSIVFVRDNGVGFDMAHSSKLFGVFQRLHRSDEFEGTGIGLANVRRIVHRHGGRTWAEGAIGQGATFYFSLPAAPFASSP